MDAKGNLRIVSGGDGARNDTDINNSGEIVGFVPMNFGQGQGFVRHPDGTVEDIKIGEHFTRATGINAQGDLVGWYRDGSVTRGCTGRVSQLVGDGGLARPLAYFFAMRSQSFSFCGNISKISSSAIRLCGMRIVNGRVYIFGSSNVISTSR